MSYEALIQWSDTRVTGDPISDSVTYSLQIKIFPKNAEAEKTSAQATPCVRLDGTTCPLYQTLYQNGDFVYCSGQTKAGKDGSVYAALAASKTVPLIPDKEFEELGKIAEEGLIAKLRHTVAPNTHCLFQWST